LAEAGAGLGSTGDRQIGLARRLGEKILQRLGRAGVGDTDGKDSGHSQHDANDG